MDNKIALQMWTIRDYLAKDFVGAYESTAKIGYTGIEIGDMGRFSPREFKNMLDDLNLTCVGSHLLMDALENDLQRVIDENLSIGCRRLVLACLDEARRKDIASYQRTADKLSEIAQELSSQAMTLSYHNHACEFYDLGGKMGYEILFDGDNQSKLTAELDVYWVAYANEDPVAWIKRLGGRLSILHMKDMEDSPDRAFCEVGAGVLDIPAIVKGGIDAGVEWFIVEQDECKRDSLDCVRLSYDNLLKSLESNRVSVAGRTGNK